MNNRSLAPSATRRTGKSLAHRIALPMLWVLSLTGLGLPQAQAIEITNQLVSVAVPGDTGTAESTPHALSSTDGRYSLFSSTSVNLVDGVEDFNSASDVFLYDRVTDSVTLISYKANSTTVTANGSSTPTAISADGEWVLFESSSADLVSGVTDSNGVNDVFLYHRITGAITLVSRSAGNVDMAANGSSFPTAISSDGMRVLFQSQSTDLVAGIEDVNGTIVDAFLYERGTGEVVLVSRSVNNPGTTANSGSSPSEISADGEWVLFDSSATDLVSRVVEGNGSSDVFLYKCSTGEVNLISRSASAPAATANNRSFSRYISADGEWVLFGSEATDLVSGVTDGNNGNVRDAFLYQRSTGVVSLISHSANSATATANGYSWPVAISDDGNWVLFMSEATNLVAGVTDGNRAVDIFFYDRSLGVARLISRSANNVARAANGHSIPDSMSPDGEWVVFTSYASDLLTGLGDRNGEYDVFLYERSTGQVSLISRSASGSTISANRMSFGESLSVNGDWVIFSGLATDLISGINDGNINLDVFVFQRSTGEISLVSRSDSARKMAANHQSKAREISADGKWVLFSSRAGDLVIGMNEIYSTEDVFLYNIDSGLVTLVSHSENGLTNAANGDSIPQGISDDGEFVLFSSRANNLVEGVSDDKGNNDVFIYHRGSGMVALVTRSANNSSTAANGDSTPVAISEDGEWVLFASQAQDLLAGVTDNNGGDDVYLYHRSTETVRLISRSSSGPVTTANHSSRPTAVSFDGEWVLFESEATDLVAGVADTNGVKDVFLYQRSTGMVHLVSHSASDLGVTADSASTPSVISRNGEWVLFQSVASDLVAGVTDANGTTDAFLYHRGTGMVSLVSHSASDLMSVANSYSAPTAISATGDWVLFKSLANDLVAGINDDNGDFDVFLYRRSTGGVSLISRSSGSATSTTNGRSDAVAVSADGNQVLFQSDATDVVAGVVDSNGESDVFLYQRRTGAASLVSHSVGSSSATANQGSFATGISAAGRTVLLYSKANDIASGVTDINLVSDVFVANIGLFSDGFEGQPQAGK